MMKYPKQPMIKVNDEIFKVHAIDYLEDGAISNISFFRNDEGPSTVFYNQHIDLWYFKGGKNCEIEIIPGEELQHA